MARWYNVQVLKKYYINEFKISDTFNLIDKCGFSFNNPSFLVSFKELIPINFKWSISVKVNFDDGIISFIYDESKIDKNSVVVFLAYEDDYYSDKKYKTYNKNTNFSLSYKTLSKLYGVKKVIFNKENNFQFTTDNLPKHWNKDNLIFFPFISKMKFSKFFTGYSIKLLKDTSYIDTYTTVVKHKICSSKSTHEKIEREKINNDKILRKFDENCFFYTIVGHCSIDHHNSQINIYANNNLIYNFTNNSKKVFGTSFNISNEVEPNTPIELFIDFNYSYQFSNDQAMEIDIIQSIYEEVVSQDYEIICLVFNKE